jgi:Fe-Mn family superoxide dismutase
MFKLPDLPYAYDALSPTIGETTMHVHHDKHHAKYVDTLNQILAETNAKPVSLEDVVREAVSDGQTKLANNAGQAWNHAVFWESMSPTPGAPSAALAAALKTAFGDADAEAFKTEFVKQGVAHFGSGWVWLIAKGEALSVITTHDGVTPLGEAGAVPLLVCDLWEHAYYLDYKNDREGFLKAWVGKLANWRFADAQFAAATGAGEPYRFPAPLAKAA